MGICTARGGSIRETQHEGAFNLVASINNSLIDVQFLQLNTSHKCWKKNNEIEIERGEKYKTSSFTIIIINSIKIRLYRLCWSVVSVSVSGVCFSNFSQPLYIVYCPDQRREICFRTAAIIGNLFGYPDISRR